MRRESLGEPRPHGETLTDLGDPGEGPVDTLHPEPVGGRGPILRDHGRVRLPRALPLVAVVLAACTSGSLRPAPTPAEELGSWAVSFTAALPAGFWEEGTHGYRLVLECPEPAGTIGGPVATLRVSSAAELRPGPVYLKTDGPGTGLLTPADLADVHPDQVLTPAVTLVGLTDADVEEVTGHCTGSFIVDGGETTPLSPGEPFQP